jgi:alginate production protein
MPCAHNPCPRRLGRRWLGLAVLASLPTLTADAAFAPPELVPGRQVKLEGRLTADGSFDAVQVVLRDVDGTVKVEGRVTAARGDHRGFTVLGFDVSYARDVTLYRGTRAGASRAEIVPGTWLEVKGTRQQNGIRAERVRIKEAPEPTEELEAVIDEVGAAGTLVVLGRQIRLPALVAVVDERGMGDAPVLDQRLRRDVDDQSRNPWRLGSRVLVGGRIESGWRQQANYDLDDSPDRDDEWQTRLQVLASAAITSSIESYTKISLYRNAERRAGFLTAEYEVEVQEAYAFAHRIGGSPISLQVGRQRFRDSREWFFDEYMDAVRASAAVGGLVIEAAIADGILAGDVAQRDRRDKRHLLGSVTRELGEYGKAGFFFVTRDDRGPADDDPRWLGGTLDLKHASGSRLWALGAARRGHRGAAALGGWAGDVGGTFVMPDVTGSPSLSLAYAYASGDGVSGDGRDTTFRQTDLEDNSAKLGGLRRLAYYGELFDPELSNLQVLTLGGGLKPRRNIGLDLVLHRYVQTVLRRSLPSSAFDDLDGTGASGLLGHEIDAAVTWRTGRLDLDLGAGVFVAGPGLTTTRRLAFFWRPQVRLYF